jgi:hypothetical protein
MDKFGEVWLLYPRSVQPEKAKKAWRAAIDRGVDPQHIVDRTVAYADSRKDEDQNFTPYLATWLNAGSYDDPIKPKQQRPTQRSGDYQPFQNYADQSVYDQPL